MSYAVQCFAARTDVLDGIAALRSRVSARMRELLAPYEGGVYALVAYHLGWTDERGRPLDAPAGKLMRPALCLTVARACGAAEDALDAAAAVELLHAFSLVHDDIEDGDRERRHRPTLWALRGIPLAINAGDSLFALAHRVLIHAAASLDSERALAALRIFSDACVRMIEGQHDDLEFEARASVALDDYLRMTSGKTGALVGASLALGALFAGAPICDVDALRLAGVDLGVAFQAVDDALSVWGDAARTGKAVGNDVARGKKSLPVVLAAERNISPASAVVREAALALADGCAARARAAILATRVGADPLAVGKIDALIDFILRREW